MLLQLYMIAPLWHVGGTAMWTAGILPLLHGHPLRKLLIGPYLHVLQTRPALSISLLSVSLFSQAILRL